MSALVEFVLYFLIVCSIVAVACSVVRERDVRRIFAEATHFFLMMVVGITIFSAVVYALDRLFIRRS